MNRIDDTENKIIQRVLLNKTINNSNIFNTGLLFYTINNVLTMAYNYTLNEQAYISQAAKNLQHHKTTEQELLKTLEDIASPSIEYSNGNRVLNQKFYRKKINDEKYYNALPEYLKRFYWYFAEWGNIKDNSEKNDLLKMDTDITRFMKHYGLSFAQIKNLIGGIHGLISEESRNHTPLSMTSEYLLQSKLIKLMIIDKDHIIRNSYFEENKITDRTDTNVINALENVLENGQCILNYNFTPQVYENNRKQRIRYDEIKRSPFGLNKYIFIVDKDKDNKSRLTLVSASTDGSFNYSSGYTDINNNDHNINHGIINNIIQKQGLVSNNAKVYGGGAIEIDPYKKIVKLGGSSETYGDPVIDPIYTPYIAALIEKTLPGYVLYREY